MGSNVNTAFVYGIGKFDDEFIVILDAIKLCTHEEFDALKAISGEMPAAQADAQSVTED